MNAQSLALLRRSATVLGLGLFVSYAYFYQAGGWNQNSRFALVRAVLEHHTLKIDAYADSTGDRAVWEGHYYCDKAPGASLLALVPVAATRSAVRACGIDPGSMKGLVWMSYMATLTTSAIFTVIAALGIFWLAVQWGASRHAALFAASAYGLATPAWSYATVFVGHGVTAGCLIAAFAAASALPDNPRRRTALAWAVGLFCGLAVITEFPAAPAVAVIVLFAVSNIHATDRRATVRIAVHIVLAGAIMGVILMAYHASAFGSPFHLAYGREDNPEGLAMQQHGFFGIGSPSRHVVYEVLFGAYRGLVPLAPLMLAGPVGLLWLARTRGQWRHALAAVAVAGFYVLLNVSYTYWEGGWFIGPRHLTPGLPFLALGLAPLWDVGRSAGRTLLIAGWLWGAAAGLIGVATTPQPPSNIMQPMSELLWPAFREGDLSLNNQSILDYGADPDRLRHNRSGHAAWNLGQLMGLDGLVSLLPLLALWCLAALLLL